jgi:transposase
VGGNKNDAHDARAIWTTMQQPGIKAVAVKTEEQQASWPGTVCVSS